MDEMKLVKLSLIVVAAGLLTLGLTGVGHAFHSGGVAECGGCHSMHSPAAGGSFLLIRSDQSSTCLDCHASNDTQPTGYHIMTYPVPGAGLPPAEMTPGGDFAWLLKTYTGVIRNEPFTELGQTHGHNVVATDFGIAADTDFATSPGGSFPSSNLTCVSCHDPHGKYRRIGGDTTYTIATAGAPIIGSGSYNNSTVPTATQAVGVYRLLAGVGYGAAAYPGVPAASVPSTYNQSEATNQMRTAYGHTPTGAGKTTWGEWCATCHAGMHSNGNYVHPVDETLGSSIANIYGAYISSSNTTGGAAASSFLSLVPFAENSGDYATLKAHAQNNGSFLNGPAPSDRVTCLSCHRAHASGFPDALRWQMEGEFITYVDGAGNAVWPGTDTTPSKPQFARGRLAAETQAAYYNRLVTVFGAYQRVLCNKCHAQD